MPVVGSYAATEANPQGIFGVILTPIAGFYDRTGYTANAIDVSLFVLIIGWFMGVATATGAIDASIARAMVRLRGRENWMIPFLMALFALGGAHRNRAWQGDAVLLVAYRHQLSPLGFSLRNTIHNSGSPVTRLRTDQMARDISSAVARALRLSPNA